MTAQLLSSVESTRSSLRCPCWPAPPRTEGTRDGLRARPFPTAVAQLRGKGGARGGGGMPWHDLISPFKNYLSWTIKIVKHKSLATLVAVGFQGDQYIKRLIYIYISPTKLRTI